MKKIKKNRGFTLAEMLIALLILLLMTAIVAGGMPVAARVYTRTVDTANAQVLLSTTVTELKYHLMSPANVNIESGGVEYDDPVYGRMRIENRNRTIYLSYLRNDTYSRPIVSDKAATKPLHLEFGSVRLENGAVIFEDLKVTNTDGYVLVNLPEIVINGLE